MHGLYTNNFERNNESIVIYDNSVKPGSYKKLGHVIYDNATHYVGGLMGFMKHGSGVLTEKNGRVYKGEFWYDNQTGKGSEVTLHGANYTGDFIDGVHHG
jgi:hypothetical protein